MLNSPEVSGSTYIDHSNLKVKTDNIRPLAWMVFIFMLSCFGIAIGTSNLKKFQPPIDPKINQFFLSQAGTHRWILRTNEQCEGFLVGGWKKRSDPGERIWFKFKIPALGNLAAQEGFISAKFGDYKNLSSLNGSLNGKELGFDGTNWAGFDSPPKELVLLIDASNGAKHLKLPSPWNRDFDSFLGDYITDQRKLVEVDKEQFRKCVRELEL